MKEIPDINSISRDEQIEGYAKNFGDLPEEAKGGERRRGEVRN